MPDLFAEIAEVTAVLKKVQASTLVAENLERALQALQENEVGRALDAYRRSLPPAPDDDWEKDTYRKQMAERADGINRAADPLLAELERIKRMRQTLNLEALDPLIREARTVIHRVHDFTASIQGG
jgi:hypothetical protein